MLAIAYAYDRDTGPDAGGREPDAAEGSIRPCMQQRAANAAVRW